jgi:hypothetical protein
MFKEKEDNEMRWYPPRFPGGSISIDVKSRPLCTGGSGNMLGGAYDVLEYIEVTEKQEEVPRAPIRFLF